MIVVNLDVMMAKRKIGLGELSEKIGLTSILQRFFSIFFLAVLLIGMTAIVVLLFLASYFT